VPTVSQDLDGKLALEKPSGLPDEALVAEQGSKTEEGLQVLDQVIAANVQLESGLEVARVDGEIVNKSRLIVSVPDQRAVDSAKRPRPERS
jgi:hypothetical protein